MGRTLIHCMNWTIYPDGERLAVGYRLRNEDSSRTVRRLMVGFTNSRETSDWKRICPEDTFIKKGFRTIDEVKWFTAGFCSGLGIRLGNHTLEAFTEEDCKRFGGAHLPQSEVVDQVEKWAEYIEPDCGICDGLDSEACPCAYKQTHNEMREQIAIWKQR